MSEMTAQKGWNRETSDRTQLNQKNKKLMDLRILEEKCPMIKEQVKGEKGVEGVKDRGSLRS